MFFMVLMLRALLFDVSVMLEAPVLVVVVLVVVVVVAVLFVTVVLVRLLRCSEVLITMVLVLV